MKRQRTLKLLQGLATPLLALAALPAGATMPSTQQIAAETVPTWGAGSFLQAGFGLVMVLALIFLCAWVARRLGLQRHSSGRLVKVVASTMVGQRERVVVVEVGTSWLVLGVTPGQIRSLHTMPAGELPSNEATSATGITGVTSLAANAFSQKLRDSITNFRRS